ncbi:hypothetical protein HME9304_01219 [Flagellimonas maritima]|uniref:Uncharacterized protein n=1 Tax=Flagellimonas maritima TaxID=1383885 RepID=A0A2Z4LR83_9FLAO|nr:hypothetical protein HME9304_01219 [Allomuricauda aurantiaca]
MEIIKIYLAVICLLLMLINIQIALKNNKKS